VHIQLGDELEHFTSLTDSSYYNFFKDFYFEFKIVVYFLAIVLNSEAMLFLQAKPLASIDADNNAVTTYGFGEEIEYKPDDSGNVMVVFIYLLALGYAALLGYLLMVSADLSSTRHCLTVVCMIEPRAIGDSQVEARGCQRAEEAAERGACRGRDDLQRRPQGGRCGHWSESASRDIRGGGLGASQPPWVVDQRILLRSCGHRPDNNHCRGRGRCQVRGCGVQQRHGVRAVRTGSDLLPLLP
jgi:hypothetical protein